LIRYELANHTEKKGEAIEKNKNKQKNDKKTTK
jgi:hypothetical protein